MSLSAKEVYAAKVSSSCPIGKRVMAYAIEIGVSDLAFTRYAHKHRCSGAHPTGPSIRENVRTVTDVIDDVLNEISACLVVGERSVGYARL